MKKVFIIIVVVFLGLNLNLQAKNYYLSAGGDDTNKGTSKEKSWKTIEKLNTVKLKPGDSVLFNRGDIFLGEITIPTSGTDEKKIVFSSYGKGSKPIITGAITVTGWKAYKDDIHVAKVNDEILQLFADGKMQTSARYPNKGYLYVDKDIDPRNEFVDNDLNQENGYWNGATIRYRPCDWVIRYGVVELHEGKKIKIKEYPSDYGKTSDEITQGSGYFFDNKFEELDSVSEWYFNPINKELYYKPISDISKVKLEGVVYHDAFTLKQGVSYVEIVGLQIANFHNYGINARGENNNINVVDNDFKNINATAIHLSTYASNCLIENNNISDINGRGIIAVESEKVTITSNNLENIGLKYGYGISGLNGMTGIVLVNIEEEKDENSRNSNNNTISYNRIKNTGYSGIRVEGVKNQVKNNVVQNAMLVMNDGGGIYSWSKGGEYYTHDVTISGNIIENVYGSKEGLISTFHMQCIGIYLDNRTQHVTVENNIICNTLKGYFSNTYSKNNIFRNNIVYNTSTGLEIGDYMNPLVTLGHVVENNLFFLEAPDQHAVKLVSYSAPSTAPMATFKGNKYYSMHEPFMMSEVLEHDNKQSRATYIYEMDVWQNKLGHDKDGYAKLYNHPWKKEMKSPFSKSTIVYNDTKLPKIIDLKGKMYYDLEGNKLPNTFQLPPFESKIMLTNY
ncbi:MAG: right-handed parallel beta-helix repeat-containing protein [bacterium]